MPRGRPPGQPKSGGRQPGSLNKLTVGCKEAIEEAFGRLGGVESLVAWGSENPDGFYAIWAKLIPRDIKVEGGDGLIKLIVVTGVPENKPQLPANDRTAD